MFIVDLKNLYQISGVKNITVTALQGKCKTSYN